MFRLDLEPSPATGLDRPSQIMVDKIATVRRERVRETIGHLDDTQLVQLNRSLALWLGIA